MKKVIIIGAGPAGITAGYELLKRSNDFDVIIFEESNRIGGISCTIPYNGNKMDIGGHRFFSKNQDVIKWWDRILPKQGKQSYDDKILGRNISLSDNGPDPESDDKVMLRRRRVSRIFYKNKFFDYPVTINWNTIRNMGMLTTLQIGFSYIHSVFHQLKEDSLESFYINRFGYKLYSLFFKNYTEKIWGVSPKVISPDWGKQRVRGLNIMALMKNIFYKTFSRNKSDYKIETSLIEEFYYPKYGPGHLWETAAEEFIGMGGKIQKNTKVSGLRTENGKVISVFTEASDVLSDNKKEEKADIIISTMPLKDMIIGMNDIPPYIKDIALGLPYRDFVTVGLLLDRMNLKNETQIKTISNIIPDCWIYVQDTEVKLGRIQIFNNWSPYMAKDPENTIWIGLEYFCAEGDWYWNMSENEWIKFGTKELIQMRIISSESNVLDGHIEKIKKAYPAYYNTYTKINEVKIYLDSFSNLYCIGRNGQHRYNNMDHSMLTAFEAINNIIEGRDDKENVWNINTEKEYLEA